MAERMMMMNMAYPTSTMRFRRGELSKNAIVKKDTIYFFINVAMTRIAKLSNNAAKRSLIRHHGLVSGLGRFSKYHVGRTSALLQHHYLDFALWPPLTLVKFVSHPQKNP